MKLKKQFKKQSKQFALWYKNASAKARLKDVTQGTHWNKSPFNTHFFGFNYIHFLRTCNLKQLRKILNKPTL